MQIAYNLFVYIHVIPFFFWNKSMLYLESIFFFLISVLKIASLSSQNLFAYHVMVPPATCACRHNTAHAHIARS